VLPLIVIEEISLIAAKVVLVLHEKRFSSHGSLQILSTVANSYVHNTFPFCSKSREVDLHSVKFPFPLSTYWFSSVDLEAPLGLTITSSLCEYPLGAQGSTSVLFLEDPLDLSTSCNES